MKIIDPMIEVENYDGIKIMKNIEKACRTCYRSEGLITNDSYKRLLTNCINRGHESVLEHEKITVRMICDIGVYKDLTRHRFANFSIESTRYCNYGKDKFNNEIKFVNPVNMDSKELFNEWYSACTEIEQRYLKMAELKATSDQLRMILPHSTAAQVTMTANIREWKHILELRASKMAHLSIQQLLIPLLLKFKEDMPEIFDNIEYNKDFPKEKYAKLIIMED